MPANNNNLSEINFNIPDCRPTFSEISYPTPSDCGPRIQVGYQIVLLYEGDCQIKINEEWHELLPGWMSLQKPGRHEYFRFASRSRTRHAWAEIVFKDPNIRVPFLEAMPFSVPITGRMRQIVDMGVSLRLNQTKADYTLMCTLALSAMREFEAEYHRNPNPAPLPDTVISAMNYIDQHFDEALDLETIAEEVATSKNHLIRLFRKHLNTTPNRYLWRIRVRRGGDLLKSTNLPMNMIAREAGFASQYHFSRLIKEHYGVTASELRQSVNLEQ